MENEKMKNAYADGSGTDKIDDELEQIRKKKLEEMMKKLQSAKNKPEQREIINKPIEVNDSNFGEIVKKYPVVVVDCWAEWCAPCRMIAPIVEELARDYAGRIVFGKLNVDYNQLTAMQYGIMGIPTLLVFKNGQNVDKIVGAMPRSMLEARIKRYL